MILCGEAVIVLPCGSALRNLKEEGEEMEDSPHRRKPGLWKSQAQPVEDTQETIQDNQHHLKSLQAAGMLRLLPALKAVSTRAF